MASGRAGLLLRPGALAALGLLLLNDRVLKAHWPGHLTGKLSDVAGLFLFPLVLAVVVDGLVGRWLGWRWDRVLLGAAAATALVFGTMKTVAPVGHAYEVGFGWLRLPLTALEHLVTGDDAPIRARVHLTADATDLVTLPAVALCWWRYRDAGTGATS